MEGKQISQAGIARERGASQQAADGQSMHVSSTCGAEPMESLKDRKVVPGGERDAQRDRLMRG